MNGQVHVIASSYLCDFTCLYLVFRHKSYHNIYLCWSILIKHLMSTNQILADDIFNQSKPIFSFISDHWFFLSVLFSYIIFKFDYIFILILFLNLLFIFSHPVQHWFRIYEKKIGFHIDLWFCSKYFSFLSFLFDDNLKTSLFWEVIGTVIYVNGVIYEKWIGRRIMKQIWLLW